MGRGCFGADVDVLAVAQHVVVADIVEIGALLVVGQNEAREGDADGHFAGADLVGCGHDRLGENRFGGGEIADEFFGALLSA